jgi:hypothetical protein
MGKEMIGELRQAKNSKDEVRQDFVANVFADYLSKNQGGLYEDFVRKCYKEMTSQTYWQAVKYSNRIIVVCNNNLPSQCIQ